MTRTGFRTDTFEVDKFVPAYFLCDTSESMGENGGIDALNKGLTDAIGVIASKSQQSRFMRLCLIAYDNEARMLIPLKRVSRDTTVPKLEANGITNFRDAVRLLTTTIKEDFDAIVASGREEAYRPVVFHFTDGKPTGQDGYEEKPELWLNPLNQLKQQAVYAPRIYAFACGEARPEHLRMMVQEAPEGSKKISDAQIEARIQYVAENAGQSIERLFRALFSTIVAGVAKASEGATQEEVDEAMDNAQRPREGQSGRRRPWGLT